MTFLKEYVIVHTIFSPSLWKDLELDGKTKWLPLNLGYHDVMHTDPILSHFTEKDSC